jgi:DNA-binding helix-hairpin-helix protein with protein kinase domain
MEKLIEKVCGEPQLITCKVCGCKYSDRLADCPVCVAEEVGTNVKGILFTG